MQRIGCESQACFRHHTNSGCRAGASWGVGILKKKTEKKAYMSMVARRLQYVG